MVLVSPLFFGAPRCTFSVHLGAHVGEIGNREEGEFVVFIGNKLDFNRKKLFFFSFFTISLMFLILKNELSVEKNIRDFLYLSKFKKLMFFSKFFHFLMFCS